MGWKEKFISKARIEIFIKMVAQVIPTYTMGIFKIPKTLFDTKIQHLQNIGGARLRMRRKYTGLIGGSCAIQKIEVGWDLEMSKLST